MGDILYSIHIQFFSQNQSLLYPIQNQITFNKGEIRIRIRKRKKKINDDNDDDDDDDDAATTIMEATITTEATTTTTEK